MDTDIRPLAVITGVLNSIRYYVAKGRNEWGFDLVIAAAIEQAGNFRVPGISIAYGPTPAL